MADVTHIYGNEIVDAAARQDIADLETTTNNLKEDLDDVETALETKAEIDGYYEEMTVGNAEQLVSTVTNADDTPYNFRTTAGSADVGDRAYVDAIVGGTVVNNQMINHGNFDAGGSWFEYACTYTFADGVATVTPTDAISRIFQNRSVVLGHKYYMTALFKGTLGKGKALLSWYGGINKFVPFTGDWQSVDMLVNNTFQSSDVWQLHYGASDNTDNTPYQIKKAMCFDLTQTFGTTIADYVYGLETATAGAGVAWLKANAPKIFDGEYIPFNAGMLQSVVGLSEKRNTGLNQWDEETEIGDIDGITGAFKTGNYLRTKNHIPVLPNTTYYFDIPSAVFFYEYDANKDVIMNGNYAYHYKSTSGTVTTGANTHYITFRNDISNASQTYHYDICINLHWDGEKDGTYEPYTLHTYAFDPTVELRGVPKLKDGKLYFDGDRYLPDGTVQRRYNYLEYDGSSDENWILQSINSSGIANFSISIPDYDTTSTSGFNDISNRFGRQTSLIGNTTTEGYMLAGGGTLYIRIASTKADTVAAFRTWLASNPTAFVYMLATSTTETATPYNPVEIVDDFGTEEFITTSLVPVGHETRYAPNLRAKLEMSPDSPDGDGLYIVQQSSGENTYIPLASSATIQNILARLTALEGNTNEG